MFFKKRNKAQPVRDSVDWLIVGLGNPGAQYAQTRHNVGFMTIDVLAEELGGNYWKNEAGAVTCKLNVANASLLLAKPQTFMNLSGSAVKKLCELYNIDPETQLIVIADELDLPSGEVQLKQSGGHAGHNGHRSLIDCLQTRDYQRIRIGIGRPPGKMDASDYVLASLRPQALEELLESAFTAASRAKELLVNTTKK
ncbi:MAG: aminoacyl-tRNA hydrolase [Coriobacteriia bacterium]|nr:aminoacyl-tRNA hydrolase [Coriobacteriia bacterium]